MVYVTVLKKWINIVWEDNSNKHIWRIRQIELLCFLFNFEVFYKGFLHFVCHAGWFFPFDIPKSQLVKEYNSLFIHLNLKPVLTFRICPNF